MTMRVSVERSPAFDAPWLVLGPAEGRVHVHVLAVEELDVQEKIFMEQN